MTKTNKITSFNITWTADHEQYWQGHGIMMTDYTHTATGCGETLREAFKDAIEDLTTQSDCYDGTGNDTGFDLASLNQEEMLAELTSQVSSPDMLDLDIVQGYCDVKGKHTITCPNCETQCKAEDGNCVCGWAVDAIEPDCAVCAGEWHYYVSIDVEVEEGEPNND